MEHRGSTVRPAVRSDRAVAGRHAGPDPHRAAGRREDHRGAGAGRAFGAGGARRVRPLLPIHQVRLRGAVEAGVGGAERGRDADRRGGCRRLRVGRLLHDRRRDRPPPFLLRSAARCAPRGRARGGVRRAPGSVGRLPRAGRVARLAAARRSSRGRAGCGTTLRTSGRCRRTRSTSTRRIRRVLPISSRRGLVTDPCGLDSPLIGGSTVRDMEGKGDRS